jgi:hypothetical protein
MKLKLPIRCQIPKAYRTKKISWLEIHEADGGFYLFQYVDIHLPPKWDTFTDTDDIDDILKDCKEIWKIDDSDWESIVDSE